MNECSDLFETLMNINEDGINLDNYAYIATVKYRDIISKLSSKLKKLPDLHTYCPTIALNNNTMFYTSNDPKYSAIYVTSGLHRADDYFDKAYYCTDHYLLTKKRTNDVIQQSVTKILQNRFRVYNSYCLIRRCDDCTILIAISHSRSLPYPEQVYQETVSTIEEVTVEYFDGLMDLYTENLPSLKYSRFATDSKYRARIIRKRERSIKSTPLSSREIECIYWISRGKTSREISPLLKISEHTVNEHKKHIMKKLNASNIAHAVREAIKAEIIS